MFALYIITGFFGLCLIYCLYLLLNAKTSRARTDLAFTSLIFLVVNILFWTLLIGEAR